MKDNFLINLTFVCLHSLVFISFWSFFLQESDKDVRNESHLGSSDAECKVEKLDQCIVVICHEFNYVNLWSLCLALVFLQWFDISPDLTWCKVTVFRNFAYVYQIPGHERKNLACWMDLFSYNSVLHLTKEKNTAVFMTRKAFFYWLVDWSLHVLQQKTEDIFPFSFHWYFSIYMMQPINVLPFLRNAEAIA